MPKLINRLHVPSIPIFWTYQKTRIEWRPSQATFYQWAQAIWAFCEGNGITKPTEDQLEAVACQQIPTSYCTGGAPRHVVSRPQHVTVGRSGGSPCCGGRR